MGIIAGARTIHQVRATVRAGFMPVMKVSWVTSPLALAFAQKFLPEHAWVPFFNIIGFVIGTYVNTHTKKKRLEALRKVFLLPPFPTPFFCLDLNAMMMMMLMQFSAMTNAALAPNIMTDPTTVKLYIPMKHDTSYVHTIMTGIWRQDIHSDLDAYLISSYLIHRSNLDTYSTYTPFIHVMSG